MIESVVHVRLLSRERLGFLNAVYCTYGERNSRKRGKTTRDTSFTRQECDGLLKQRKHHSSGATYLQFGLLPLAKIAYHFHC